jgi:potassium-dependent mechanosensitive channel
VVAVLFVVFVKRVIGRSRMTEDTRAIVLRWFRVVYRVLLFIAIVALVTNLMGHQIRETLRSIVVFLREPFYVAGATRISILTLLLLVPVFYVAGLAGSVTRQVIERRLFERLSLDPSRRFSFLSIARYIVMILVVVIGLTIIGIDLSTLAVMFGVLGVGIGFGLQGVVANFFAGITIILTRPIKEGDRINITDLEGDVRQIRLLYSVVNTISNETLIIPNRHIVETVVHNQSYDEPSIVLRTDVQVSYKSDLDQVRIVLLAVGQRSLYRIVDKDAWVIYRSFDDSGITVTLAIPIRNAADRHVARSDTIIEIWRAFRKNGIEIPFPQTDLHVKELPPA